SLQHPAGDLRLDCRHGALIALQAVNSARHNAQQEGDLMVAFFMSAFTESPGYGPESDSRQDERFVGLHGFPAPDDGSLGWPLLVSRLALIGSTDAITAPLQRSSYPALCATPFPHTASINCSMIGYHFEKLIVKSLH
ncbi:MAG: hypothetical protein ACRC91_17055, partial [Aeromonas sp.]